jgi:hypothetical protein
MLWPCFAASNSRFQLYFCTALSTDGKNLLYSSYDYCKEIYNTIWFTAKSLQALPYLSRGKPQSIKPLSTNKKAPPVDRAFLSNKN